MRFRQDDGFTLVEALVALIIIILISTMLYRGLSNGMRISAAADGTEEALLVAKAHLAALGIETPLQAGTQDGEEEGVSWRIVVWPYAGTDSIDSIVQPQALQAFWATITVSWRERGSQPRSFQLTTLKLAQAEQ